MPDIQQSESESPSLFSVLLRRCTIALFMPVALYDGLVAVRDYKALAKAVHKQGNNEYSRFRLHCRFRAAHWIMRLSDWFNRGWACREYSVMLLRACLREGAPALLRFEVRKEDDGYTGHMSIIKGPETDIEDGTEVSDSVVSESDCITVDFPFVEDGISRWKRG
jgi:hypothetical protein